MDSQQFAQVTRRGCLEDVLDGIRAALACPGLSVKINTVPVIEEPENLVQMAHLAKDHPLHVRFIEMMPIGYGREYPFRGEEAMVEILQQAYGTLHPIAERYGNGPCHYYEVEGFEGKIGFISAMSHKFCSQCNRVRLTSEGYMKACLQYQTGADLRTMLRNGVTDDQLTETIRDVIWNKPVSHNFHETATRQDEIRSMSQIGG
jgi:cyclic pyranopterin phosphate synthase